MGKQSTATRGYGSREDDANSQLDDEEAQPLHRETFEIDDNLARWRKPTPDSYRLGWDSLSRWVNRPQKPQRQRIDPWIPSIQERPPRTLDYMFPDRRGKLLLGAAFCVLWGGVLAVLIGSSAGTVETSNEVPQYVDCVDTFWKIGNNCGLDGDQCQPFSGSSLVFRCPANCAGVRVLNPYPVGTQEVVYRPLVIGGPTYRGDSFICGSAIHAGILSGSNGGCGIVSRIGQHSKFPSTLRNGLESIEFDSYFPSSFTFSEAPCKGGLSQWSLFTISLLFTGILSLFTVSPSFQFFAIFTAIFTHVSLVSDPDPSGISHRSLTVLADLFSTFAGRFLPAIFCAVVLYWICVRRTLRDLTAQIEKTILWLGGCWIGALSNYTFSWIPISRLTSHDLEAQPGAKLALIVVILIIMAIVFQQIYYFRLEGRLSRYLALYGLFAFAIFFLLLIPGLELRIHHYIIGLLLLPGTSLQTRPSLLYQGLLIGLFINGIARWGFAPILQTPEALRDKDGAYGSLIPKIPTPIINTSNITFEWPAPDYDGISVLVNDVERHRYYFGQESQNSWTWTRAEPSLPEYFRFAYLRESTGLDYSKAGIWNANGSWTDIIVPL